MHRQLLVGMACRITLARAGVSLHMEIHVSGASTRRAKAMEGDFFGSLFFFCWGGPFEGKEGMKEGMPGERKEVRKVKKRKREGKEET